jgi:hypothetical protein
MSTTATEVGVATRRSAALEGLATRASLVVSGLVVLVLAIHGYHPWAEDGGLYAAGIKHLLRPELYPHSTEFVAEHLRFSLFAPAVAQVTRWSHLPLDWVLFLLYCVSLWTTLYASWMLTSRCFATARARWGGVVLLACWMSLPVAGTSLMLVDPYVTARSFSTPLVVLALCGALDMLAGRRMQGFVLGGVSLLAAMLIHPLMAGYGLAAVLLVFGLGARFTKARWWGTGGLVAGAFMLASLVQWKGAAESAAYLPVVMSRYYWFPAQWEWYERLGLVAPLIVLAVFLVRRSRAGIPDAYTTVLRAASGFGLVALAVALCFSRAALQVHAVARLQPLRCFQTVYLVMIVMLGGWISEYWLGRVAWRWAVLVVAAGGPLWFAQRQIYPASLHLELPGRREANSWSQAFVWVREHTPNSAFFAMDPHYITRDGEDAQCFRTIAERSALPDYSKDGGEASITPSLTTAWSRGQQAQEGIDEESDASRVRSLAPLGVDWVVLHASSATAFDCPYRNDVVKVCRLAGR